MRTMLTHRAVAWLSAAAFVTAAVVIEASGFGHGWGDVAVACLVGAGAVTVGAGLRQQQRRRDWAEYAAQLRRRTDTAPPAPRLRVVTEPKGGSLDRSAPAGLPLPRNGRRASQLATTAWRGARTLTFGAATLVLGAAMASGMGWADEKPDDGRRLGDLIFHPEGKPAGTVMTTPDGCKITWTDDGLTIDNCEW